MDTIQARDHLDSVATIVRTADRSLHVPPWVFVVWGLFATTINALKQARDSGVAIPGDSMIQLPLLLLAAGATVWLSWRSSDQRETLIDRHTGVVFSVVFAVLLIANLTLQHRMVPYEAMAVFWSLGFAIALLIVGFEASRPLLFGGVALLAAAVATAWAPGWFNGLLAAGWFAGMVVPGLVLASTRSD